MNVPDQLVIPRAWIGQRVTLVYNIIMQQPDGRSGNAISEGVLVDVDEGSVTIRKEKTTNVITKGVLMEAMIQNAIVAPSR